MAWKAARAASTIAPHFHIATDHRCFSRANQPE
jgi:hypothetical protein